MTKAHFDNHYFILDENGEPVLVDTIEEWGNWFETAERHVGDTHILGIRISTVFLGTNHNWGPGPPILYETMIFGGWCDQDQWRYQNRVQALRGHKLAIRLVIRTLPLSILIPFRHFREKLRFWLRYKIR